MAKAEKNNLHFEIMMFCIIAISFILGTIYVLAFYDKPSKVTGSSTDGASTFTERYYCTVDSEAEALGIAIEVGGELKSYDNGVGVIIIHRLNGVLGSAIGEEEIETNNGVLKKEDIYTIDDDTRAPKTNPLYAQEWYLEAIDVNNTYKNGITGTGALVAVIDTGCQIDHPDLQKNIVGWYNAADPASGNVTDIDGHGTHVAGIIAAVDNNTGVVGVAPDASLYIIKADHNGGYFYSSDIIRGINKAIEVGADVINMSFGNEYHNEDIEEALERATANGTLCVAAAGNEHLGTPHYPAANKCVVGVGGYNYSRHLCNNSNFGVNANIVAPGENIWSTYISGDYISYSGTSMASPVVAGVAALIYGSNENLRTNNTSASRDYVFNTLMQNRLMQSYSSAYGTVTGSVNVQNIFKLGAISAPKTPTITQKKQEDTNQILVKLETKTNDAEIWYTLDGSYPSVGVARKYTGKIHLDKKGKYKLRAVAVKGRSYSKTLKKTIKVEGKIYSQDLIKSMRIHFKNEKSTKAGIGKEKQLYVTFDAKPKKKVDLKLIKWSTSDKNLATVSADGKVKVTSDKKKAGKQVTITGKFGSVKKKFTFTLK